MPKIAPVAVVSIFEGVGGLACVGTVEDLLVLGLVVRLVVIAGGLAGRGLAMCYINIQGLALSAVVTQRHIHSRVAPLLIIIILFVMVWSKWQGNG